MEKVKFYNGVEMPILGFGVYQISKSECERCVSDAIEIGYRHFDTAQAYGNEEEVGNAIQKSGIPREEFFITTKVWVSNYGYEECRKSVFESLKKLKTDYIDLMLLHQPFNDYYGAWHALEALYSEGKIRAIGISNFLPDRVVDISNFAKVKPMINQIEMNPLHQRNEDKKWHDKYDIITESWASFGEGRNNMFSNPTIEKIGKKYNKSVAQVILRWLIQRGVVVIPKSTHKERMAENFNVFDFELSSEDMQIMASLDTKQSLLFSHSDPSTVEWFVQFVKGNN